MSMGDYTIGMLCRTEMRAHPDDAIALHQVRQMLHHMAQQKPTCGLCKSMGYSEGVNMHEREGWERAMDFAGFVKRCESCAKSLAWPWAAKLDPVAVLRLIREREAAGEMNMLSLSLNDLFFLEAPPKIIIAGPKIKLCAADFQQRATPKIEATPKVTTQPPKGGFEFL
jgi:hypothetical protein